MLEVWVVQPANPLCRQSWVRWHRTWPIGQACSTAQLGSHLCPGMPTLQVALPTSVPPFTAGHAGYPATSSSLTGLGIVTGIVLIAIKNHLVGVIGQLQNEGIHSGAEAAGLKGTNVRVNAVNPCSSASLMSKLYAPCTMCSCPGKRLQLPLSFQKGSHCKPLRRGRTSRCTAAVTGQVLQPGISRLMSARLAATYLAGVLALEL